jgi:hypothetical protein
LLLVPILAVTVAILFVSESAQRRCATDFDRRELQLQRRVQFRQRH